MSLLVSLLSGAGGGSGTVTEIQTAGLATGGPITETGTITVTAASQAQQETGTATDVAVTPGRQQFHQSAAKAWAYFTSVTTTAIIASYNMSIVTDHGTGDTTLGITTNFSSANFAAVAIVTNGGTSGTTGSVTVVSQAASSVRIRTHDINSTSAFDAIQHVVCYGDQ